MSVDASSSRSIRNRGIRLAWGSSLISKVTTFGAQVLAVPLVYHALGQGQYAAYAAVTASAGLISALNLGIGGSLVTPLAGAAAGEDKIKQAALFQSGLTPLIVISFVSVLVALPIVLHFPLTTLFGKIGDGNPADLRAAAVLAVCAAAFAIPLSGVDSLRQAYQELHIGNIVGAGANVVLCVLLIVAAKYTSKVSIFVAIFVMVPLLGRLVNGVNLLTGRPFLLGPTGGRPFEHTSSLLGDGLRYVSSSFAYVLIYQWPVYYVVRSLDTAHSAVFAITIQAALLPISFMVGLVQPLWSAMANASTEKDHLWQRNQVKYGRRVVFLAGLAACLSIATLGESIIAIWLRKSIELPWELRLFAGLYVLFAIWEYYHFVLALGIGLLRQGTMVVFARSLAFAAAVPILLHFGGVLAIWMGLCLSGLYSSWRLSRIVTSELQRNAIA